MSFLGWNSLYPTVFLSSYRLLMARTFLTRLNCFSFWLSRTYSPHDVKTMNFALSRACSQATWHIYNLGSFKQKVALGWFYALTKIKTNLERGNYPSSNGMGPWTHFYFVRWVSSFVLVTIISASLKLNRLQLAQRGEMWRHVTMVAKFLELNNVFWQRRPLALSNNAEEHYGLSSCSWVQSCTGKSYLSVFKSFFPAIFAKPRFVEIQKFCFHGNVTKRLLSIRTS